MSKAPRFLSLSGSTLETDAFSLSYPACPPSDNQKKPVQPDEQHSAPVFTPSILGNLSRGTAGGPKALHNLMSQAVDEAPSCKGQYPMVIFAPTAGGQRQAYTQAASELASLGHVVLTVDYPYLSGAVEGKRDKTVQFSTFGDWIKTGEALTIQTNDLQSVYSRLVNKDQPLSGLPFWTNNTTVQLDACIFGHGTGGRVAQVMVETHIAKCGGPLEGILTLPAPFNREKTATRSGPTVNNTRPSVNHTRPSVDHTRPSGEPFPHPSPPRSARPVISQASLDLSPPTRYGLIQLLQRLRDTALNTFGLLICSAQGTCGAQSSSKRAPVQKRSVDDDPWYYPKKPYKDPCYDEDYDYDYDEHYPGCDDDHYDDDYDYYDDPREDYDPCDPYDGPYKPPYKSPYNPPYEPSRPYPPPGIFPPNITWPPYAWPPYGDGKIPDYNGPWDDQWDDYHNHGGGYGRKYGHKDCDYFDGGYPDGYEGDYGDDYDCDHRPDHYREWDKKHHCHGYVDDHDDDWEDDDWEDDDWEDDDWEDDDYEDDDWEDDYDDHDHYGDCHKKHHRHGHVDDHEDEYEDDYDYDHGYVDDWDDEDRA